MSESKGPFVTRIGEEAHWHFYLEVLQKDEPLTFGVRGAPLVRSNEWANALTG